MGDVTNTGVHHKRCRSDVLDHGSNAAPMMYLTTTGGATTTGAVVNTAEEQFPISRKFGCLEKSGFHRTVR